MIGKHTAHAIQTMETTAGGVGTKAPGGQLQSKPLSDYSLEDQAFYDFWYGHLQNDQMTGGLKYVAHSTARYIWDAACRRSTDE